VSPAGIDTDAAYQHLLDFLRDCGIEPKSVYSMTLHARVRDATVVVTTDGYELDADGRIQHDGDDVKRQTRTFSFEKGKP
jgi:hypothetical protein